MPNQRDRSKTLVSALISEEDFQKIKKLAKEANTSLARIVDAVLHDSLSDVELTPEDYEEIARRIREKETK